LTGLVKSIDRAVDEASSTRAEDRKLGVFVIIGDADGRAEQLKELAKKEGLTRVSFCIGTAPPRYEVNKDADVTVVIYTVGRPGRQEVTANFALRKGELSAAKRGDITEALSKVLPKR
jgi:hypothetical protein